MKEYDRVPGILTGKDLDYLQDAFNWNQGAYKNTLDAVINVDDKIIKKVLNKCLKSFYCGMADIINIVDGGYNEDTK